MARRRRQSGRKVNGILLLDKPLGISSNAALQRVKKLFNAQKAGHTGSLDPLATGLLPICFGEATKMSSFLLDADKSYEVVVKLGVKTTTGDAEGEIVSQQSDVKITQAQLNDVLPDFIGAIEQIPPMYSALKQNGQPLYKLARQGIEVERKPRQVTIHDLNVISLKDDLLEIHVRCSKGTYIRTLAEDIGDQIGCGAHVARLRRVSVAAFDGKEMLTIDQLEELFETQGFEAMDETLLPIDSSLGQWPEIKLTDDVAYFLKKGQAVLVPKAPTHGWVRIYAGQERFLGVGCILDDGRVAPKRLVNM